MVEHRKKTKEELEAMLSSYDPAAREYAGEEIARRKSGFKEGYRKEVLKEKAKSFGGKLAGALASGGRKIGGYAKTKLAEAKARPKRRSRRSKRQDDFFGLGGSGGGRMDFGFSAPKRRGNSDPFGLNAFTRPSRGKKGKKSDPFGLGSGGFKSGLLDNPFGSSRRRKSKRMPYW